MVATNLYFEKEELRRKSKNGLIKIVLSLVSRVKELEQEVDELRSEASKSRIAGVNKRTNQPSSKKAEWEKDPPKKKGRKGKRKKRPGCGNRSKKELKPDEENYNPLEECPGCGNDLSSTEVLETPSRIIEDIKGPCEETVVSEEIQERKWCRACKKLVSSVTEKALPGSDVGLNAMVLVAYLWVVPALSLPNIERFLRHFRSMKLSTAGLSRMMIRLSGILEPLCEEILEDVKNGTNIWADETGWKIKGNLWWLWIFANKRSAYYWADKSRGSLVVEKILGTYFYGLLISDAWCAYKKLVCSRQTCMSHIFRKIRNFIKEYPQYRSLLTFFSKLKRIIRDGERLQLARDSLDEVTFQRRLKYLKNRLHELLAWKNPNPILRDLTEKVRRQEQYVLTFVEHPGGSMSEEGARAYACLQSIAQTCHLRNISLPYFLKTTLTHYIRHGKPMSFAQFEALHASESKLAV